MLFRVRIEKPVSQVRIMRKTKVHTFKWVNKKKLILFFQKMHAQDTVGKNYFDYNKRMRKDEFS